MAKSPAQQLRPLILNESWELLEEYMAGEKARLVIQLCKCTEDLLKDLQGQIKTIDSLLKLRENLKTEMGSTR